MAEDGPMPTENCDTAESEACDKECNGATARQAGKRCTRTGDDGTLTDDQRATRLDIEAHDIASRIGGGGFV